MRRQGRLLYWLGAPGVGALLAICAPLVGARRSGAVKVIPVPESSAPAACANVSGAATALVAPPSLPPLPPPAAEATTAASWLPPRPMVMVRPALKPHAP